MRCNGVIDFIVTSRRHVGSILSVNKNETKMRKSEIVTQMLFANRGFQLAYNSTHKSLQAHANLRRTLLQQYTSNMEAVICVKIMT